MNSSARIKARNMPQLGVGVMAWHPAVITLLELLYLEWDNAGKQIVAVIIRRLSDAPATYLLPGAYDLGTACMSLVLGVPRESCLQELPLELRDEFVTPELQDGTCCTSRADRVQLLEECLVSIEKWCWHRSN